MIREKKSTLALQHSGQTQKVVALPGREVPEDLLLGGLEGPSRNGVALAPLSGENGPNGPPVLRVVFTGDEPFRFQSVDELGDVRLHARTALGEGAQG